MTLSPANSLALDTTLFRPGMRVVVAVSGGADSVALLRTLLARRESLGLVLSVAHLHHGIRGEEADRDADFVAALAAQFDLPLHLHRVDTPGVASANRETLEEGARHLRYAWFRELINSGCADVVATAHTLDDQAETVLHRLLRGSWTEGLSGIHPSLDSGSQEPSSPAGSAAAARPVPARPIPVWPIIVRPMLGVRRAEVEAFLRALGQPWREDSTNQDDGYTRNRLRHQLLPALAEYNPQISLQLAQLATLARDEEVYWQAELRRLLPSLLMPGKAVRGGGRAASTRPDEASVAIEIERLRPFPAALRRRILRAAARQIGCALNFEQTERLMGMCGFATAKCEQFTAEFRAQRTPRELRLLRSDSAALPHSEYLLPIPGEIVAADYGFRLRAEMAAAGAEVGLQPGATLRPARPGDRVQLRHSRSPKKIKEILERMGVPAEDRSGWPVLEWQGQILWMKGADVRCGATPGLILTMELIT